MAIDRAGEAISGIFDWCVVAGQAVDVLDDDRVGEPRGDADVYDVGRTHKEAMVKLLDWCDEASVAHWEQEDPGLVSWEAADYRMRETGRPSKVRHPSAAHAELAYLTPRTTRGVVIRRD